MKFPLLFPSRRILLLACLGASLGTTLHGQTLYWDTNGSTPGAGNPANGDWNITTANFSTDSTGSIATEVYTADRDVVFSAGSDVGTAAINVTSSVAVGILTFEEGSYSITGQTLTSVNGIVANSGAGSITISNAISFANDFTANIASGVSVTAGQMNGGSNWEKTGAGTLTVRRLDATATIKAGVLILNSDGNEKAKNTTIDAGATLRMAANNGIINTYTVTVNGTFEFNAGISDRVGNLTGSGLITGAAGSQLTFGNGTATYSGNISGAIQLVKEAAGTQTMGGQYTNTGNTTINTGTLTYADNSLLTFYIGANGVNNTLGGVGTANLNGDFAFDLSGAAALGSWQIVDVTSLTETFGSTFLVRDFTEVEDGIWSNGAYTFSEFNGQLTSVPEPTASAVLGLLGIGFLAVRRRRN